MANDTVTAKALVLHKHLDQLEAVLTGGAEVRAEESPPQVCQPEARVDMLNERIDAACSRVCALRDQIAHLVDRL